MKAPLPAEMPRTFDGAEMEKALYDWWEAQGYFKPRIEPGVKPFVISMPPPTSPAPCTWGTPSRRRWRMPSSATTA